MVTGLLEVIILSVLLAVIISSVSVKLGPVSLFLFLNIMYKKPVTSSFIGFQIIMSFSVKYEHFKSIYIFILHLLI